MAERGLRALVSPGEGSARAAGRTLAALAATVGLVAAMIAALGASPGDAFYAIVVGALGTTYDFGNTVMITSLLALTGLAAAIPFSARLWNVGGEGQLYFGAFVAAGLPLALPSDLPAWFFAPLVVVVAALGGAVWAAVPGVLKAAVNANEVITSLMMTFVALQLANYAITVVWPEGSRPQTADVPGASTLPNIWSSTLVTAGAPIALLAVVVAWVVMNRTGLGFEIRATGLNRNAARLNGMHIRRVTVLSFMLGGAFAGLAGAINVLGMNGALVTGFSAQFGFLGIAVALIARLEVAWILPSALFFAILRVGSSRLQVETGLAKDIGEMIVATFIFLLLTLRVIRLRYAEAAV